jgi:hypothetical protein
MARASTTCHKTTWKGRPAISLANECLELVTLTGGGSIAELRLRLSGELSDNVLWEPPWPTMDPDKHRPRTHDRVYGPAFVGKFLASFTGHALCLDYFGAPSEEEIGVGLCLHGEAAVSRWKVVQSADAELALEATLPVAGLKVRRELRLRKDESVVYVRETIRNLRQADHFFHWTQHVTLGPPFLEPGESVIALPGGPGMSWPHGYEGRSLLASSQEFEWPYARTEEGSRVDLSRPFVQPGRGFVAAVLLRPENHAAYVVALNFKLGLAVGYCFSRQLFPWIAVWEENRARKRSPWNGRTQARGLEFGTTPMPVGKREAFLTGPLFGVPTCCCVPAKGEIEANYLLFLARVPGTWREVSNVSVESRGIVLRNDVGSQVEVSARELQRRLFR